MNYWSAERKRIIFLMVLLVLVILIGVPLYFFLHKTPTCTDNLQNGDETGVDCGGSCQLICSAESLPMITKGDVRVLKVATSTYESVIVVQNPNLKASVERAIYVVSFYEASSSVPLRKIQAETYIPRASTFGLFLGPYDFKDSVPVRASFEWKDESLVWKKDTSTLPPLTVFDTVLTSAETAPRIDTSLKNESLVNVSNIELVALVSYSNGNTIAASKTFVDTLRGGEVVPLVFTWPNSFSATSSAVEILPRVLPDKSYLN